MTTRKQDELNKLCRTVMSEFSEEDVSHDFMAREVLARENGIMDHNITRWKLNGIKQVLRGLYKATSSWFKLNQGTFHFDGQAPDMPAHIPVESTIKVLNEDGSKTEVKQISWLLAQKCSILQIEQYGRIQTNNARAGMAKARETEVWAKQLKACTTEEEFTVKIEEIKARMERLA